MCVCERWTEKLLMVHKPLKNPLLPFTSQPFLLLRLKHKELMEANLFCCPWTDTGIFVAQLLRMCPPIEFWHWFLFCRFLIVLCIIIHIIFKWGTGTYNLFLVGRMVIWLCQSDGKELTTKLSFCEDDLIGFLHHLKEAQGHGICLGIQTFVLDKEREWRNNT